MCPNSQPDCMLDGLIIVDLPPEEANICEYCWNDLMSDLEDNIKLT